MTTDGAVLTDGAADADAAPYADAVPCDDAVPTDDAAPTDVTAPGGARPARCPRVRRVSSPAERLQEATHALVRAEAVAGVRGTGSTLGRPGVRPSGTEVLGLPGPAAAPVGGAPVGGAPVGGAWERFLPLPDALAGIVSVGGLRRGSVARVAGSVSLLLDVVAAACRGGAWCAVVGMPDLGLAAAAEAGLPLERVAVVPRPGADAAAVLAAVIDGFDVVVAGEVPFLADRDRRRLSTRVRHRGAVLLTPSPWPAAELVLSALMSRWSGPGRGEGSLRGRETSVVVSGRGAAVGQGGRHRLCSVDGLPLLRLADGSAGGAGAAADLGAREPGEEAAPVVVERRAG